MNIQNRFIHLYILVCMLGLSCLGIEYQLIQVKKTVELKSRLISGMQTDIMELSMKRGNGWEPCR